MTASSRRWRCVGVALVVLVTARGAWGQGDPGTGAVTRTPDLGLPKAGRGVPATDIPPLFWELANDIEATRTLAGSLAARPAPGQKTRLYIVQDCKTPACVEGGGGIRCLTWTTNASTPTWVVQFCGDSAIDVTLAGAACGDTVSDAAAWTAATAVGKHLRIPDGCFLTLPAPGNGNAAITLPSTGITVDCHGISGVAVSQRACVGGHYPGAACSVTADCLGGGTCTGTQFAPSGQTVAIFRAASGARDITFRNCRVRARQFSTDGTSIGYGTLVGGTNAGRPCRLTCSNNGDKACNADADCSPGTCTHLADLAGGTCTGETGAPAGTGKINVFDLPGSVDARLDDIVVTDLRASATAVKIGAGTLRRLDLRRRTPNSYPANVTAAPAIPTALATLDVGVENGVGARVVGSEIVGTIGIKSTTSALTGKRTWIVNNTIDADGVHTAIATALETRGWYQVLTGNETLNVDRCLVGADVTAGDSTVSDMICLCGKAPCMILPGAGWIIDNSYIVQSVGGASGMTCAGGPNAGLACQNKCVGGAGSCAGGTGRGAGCACDLAAQCSSGTCDHTADCPSGGTSCDMRSGVIEVGNAAGIFAHSKITGNLIVAQAPGTDAIYIADNGATTMSLSSNELLEVSSNLLFGSWLATGVQPTRGVNIRLAGGTTKIRRIKVSDNTIDGFDVGVALPTNEAQAHEVTLGPNAYTPLGYCTTGTAPGSRCEADAECAGGGTCSHTARVAVQNWNWSMAGDLRERGSVNPTLDQVPTLLRLEWTGGGAQFDAVKVDTGAPNRVTQTTSGSAFVGCVLQTPTSGRSVLIAGPGSVTTCAYTGTAPAIGDALSVSGTAGKLQTGGTAVARALATGSGGLVRVLIL